MNIRKIFLITLSITIFLSLTSAVWLDAENLGVAVESTLNPVSEVDKPPVVFIMMESTRADHLGPCYGYERNTSPRICDVAEDGILFENAYSTGSWTIISLPSMIRSRWPMTGALPGFNYSAEAGPLYEKTASDYNLVKDRCADRWWLEADMERRTIDNITEDSFYTSFIGKQAHFPHLPAEEFRKWDDVNRSTYRKLQVWRETDPQYEEFSSRNYSECHTYGDKIPRELVGAVHKNLSVTVPEIYRSIGRENYVALYDEEILQADRRVSKRMEELKEKGMYEDSLIVIASDHGQGLGEHGNIFHGYKPYEEQIHVPLIIKLPENRLADTRIESPVRLIDIPPTILDVLGYNVPKQFQGESLLPVIYGEVYSNSHLKADRPIISTGRIKNNYTYREEKYKLMVEDPISFCGGDNTDIQLFNLANDPEEKTDLSGKKSSEVSKLRESFCPLFLEEIESPRIDQKDRELKTEQKERLRALGYLE